MFLDVPANIPLWRHQEEALRFLVERLGADGPPKPFLIRMPTGTGKTGVIACLAQQCTTGRTLILTPWSSLREQLVKALSEGFWEKVGAARPSGLVAEMRPANVENVLGRRDVQVIVCTFSALNMIRRDDPRAYGLLASSIETVVVDEGHYEPAVEWGKSVKGLQRPTVLLTATPYRNDLKLFRIHEGADAVYDYTHAQAEQDGIVRKLTAQDLDGDVSDPSELTYCFIDKWRRAIREKSFINSAPRAILCCSGAPDIEAVVEVLRDEGLDAIGIHDTFAGSKNPSLLQHVPTDEVSANIWVHQKKLTEGLDDHRFCCLVFLCPVGNDRKLVQQIGRVLRRNEADDPGKTALMWSPAAFGLEERWNAYREFEQDAQLRSPDRYRQFVHEMLRAQPATEYFDGRFRKRFSPDLLSADPQVVISPSVLVREVSPDFDLREYIEDCTDTLNLADALILGRADQPCQQSARHAVWVYASIANSRLLLDTSFYEIRLQAHCVVLVDGYLLISDTTGTFPQELIDAKTATIGSGDLARLLASYTVTTVSVASAVPFDTVLRASQHRGQDLSKIPVSLTDRIQICQAARGTSAQGRRYLGLQRGRVREELSEQRRREHSVSEFIAWSHAVALALNAAIGGNAVLGRYMQAVSPPERPTPVSMSVDLSAPNISITFEGEPLTIEHSSRPIENIGTASSSGLFICTLTFVTGDEPARRVPVRLQLEYLPVKRRFGFKATGASGVRVEESGDRLVRRSLAEYLNQNQEVVLLGMKGGELVYQGRNFYEINYTHAERLILESVVQPKRRWSCDTEKGSNELLEKAKEDGSKATRFLKGSLFEAIAEDVLPLGFGADLIVCDDLRTECADFVLANFESKQIALVHAKAGDGAGISASAFHEVVAQAMKNLVYLSRNAEKPKGASKWTTREMWNRTSIPRLYRKPTGCPEGTRLWHKIRTDIIDAAGAQLHVVLATTGCCNLTALHEAVNDPAKRTSETAQLFHLLDGLIGYARQLGVKVTVVDVPYKPSKAKRVGKQAVKKPAAKKVPAT